MQGSAPRNAEMRQRSCARLPALLYNALLLGMRNPRGTHRHGRTRRIRAGGGPRGLLPFALRSTVALNQPISKEQSMRTTKPSIYQQVTDRIVAALEAGTIPWHRPWRSGLPSNAVSGREY